MGNSPKSPFSKIGKRSGLTLDKLNSAFALMEKYNPRMQPLTMTFHHQFSENWDHLINEHDLFKIAGIDIHQARAWHRRSVAAKLGWKRRKKIQHAKNWTAIEKHHAKMYLKPAK